MRKLEFPYAVWPQQEGTTFHPSSILGLLSPEAAPWGWAKAPGPGAEPGSPSPPGGSQRLAAGCGRIHSNMQPLLKWNSQEKKVISKFPSCSVVAVC